MEETTKKPARHRYIVHISFYVPEAGPIQVFAENEQQARELAPILVPHLKDVKVHDVFLAADMEDKLEPPQNAPAAATLN